MYTNRYKPEHCSSCGLLLGGTFIPKHPKRPKLDIPLSSCVVLGPWSVYSCKTSTHDDRCLVIKDLTNDRPSVVCLNQKCKETRAVMVNSNASDLFICEHIKTIESAVNLGNQFLAIPNVQEYQGDESVKSELLRLEGLSRDLPLAVQVSPTMFCVFGPVTANNPAGYCHVKVQEDSFRCCSKDCKTIVAKGKQLKARNICIHVHILISLGVIHSDKIVTRSSPASTSTSASTSLSGAELIGTNVAGSPGSEIPSSTKAGSMAPTMPNSTASDEPVDTVSRTSTVQLNMKRSLPLQIPTVVIQQAHLMDIKGWPPSLAPPCVTCGLCSGPLSGEKSHPGQRGESLVLTNLNPFRKIKLLVKFCLSPSCQAMHQVFPYDIGNKYYYYIHKVD